MEKIKYICEVDGKKKIIMSEINTAKKIAEKVRLKNTKSIIVRDKNGIFLNYFCYGLDSDPFLAGVMYAAQTLVAEGGYPSIAVEIIRDAGFLESDVRLCQKNSGFKNESMKTIIDEAYN